MPAERAATTPYRLSSTTPHPPRAALHPPSGVQEQVRCGFAPRDLGGAEDPPLEQVPEAGAAQGPAHLVVAPAGGHARTATAPPHLLHRGAHPRPGLQLPVGPT